jgi:hypothetical protein
VDILDSLNASSDPTGLGKYTIDDIETGLIEDIEELILTSMRGTIAHLQELDDDRYLGQVRFACNYALVALVDRLYIALDTLSTHTHNAMIYRRTDLDPNGVCAAAVKYLHIKPQINFKMEPSDESTRASLRRLRGARDARNLIVHENGILRSGEIPVEGAKEPSKTDVEKLLPACVSDVYVSATPEVVELIAADAKAYFSWLVDKFRECWRILDFESSQSVS